LQQRGPSGLRSLQWQNAGTETITQRKRGFVNAPWFAFLICVA
jgi:hypothetical protein